MPEPQALVLSDLHLNASPRRHMSEVLGRLLERHPNAELILNGDVFEFSTFSAREEPRMVLKALLENNQAFVAQIRAHLSRGAKVTFIAGNHDAALPQLTDAMDELLGTSEQRPSVAPWFIRRGDVHVEHGHVYDPDNAPLHPLADWQPESEPLGSALMRRFVAGAGASEFAHAHDTTPVRGILRAFRLYGPRAPWLIARYFQTAFTLCWEAATARAAQVANARLEGAERLCLEAAAQSVAFETVEALCDAVAKPTHADFGDIFRRLYFDRVLAGAMGVGAFYRFVLGGNPAALAALGLATGYLAISRSLGGYHERPCLDLRTAADVVAGLTGASRVVFGHTHVEESTERYLNLGSFTYCRHGAHPYAMLLDGERVERGHIS